MFLSRHQFLQNITSELFGLYFFWHYWICNIIPLEIKTISSQIKIKLIDQKNLQHWKENCKLTNITWNCLYIRKNQEEEANYWVMYKIIMHSTADIRCTVIIANIQSCYCFSRTSLWSSHTHTYNRFLYYYQLT